MKEELFLEHDDLECDECKTNEGSYQLNFYTGTINGRDAHKYSCTNKDCGYEKIEFIDEMHVNEDGTITEIKNDDVGKKVTLSDGYSKRILKQDQKGLYVIKDSVRIYVEYHSTTGTYRATGEWGHK
jgi:hypothetical protein